jgi:hypothetical protein
MAGRVRPDGDAAAAHPAWLEMSLLNDPDYNSPHMGFIGIAWHTVDEASVTVVCFSSIGVLGGKAGVVEFERSAIPG